MEELVSELTLKPQKLIEKTLFELKKSLENVPACGPLNEQEAQALLKENQMRMPFPNSFLPKENVNYSFGFQKPSIIHVVGSFLLQTLSKSPTGLSIDVAVQMPKDLFQEKDYLNYRYAHKRAFYLAMLASHLQASGLFKVSFEAFHGDLRRPILILSTQDLEAHQISIRLFPTITGDTFLLSRLAPHRNNIRSATQPATPYYNASILLDTCMVSHLNYLHSIKSNAKHWTESILLSKVWLHQRFSQNSGINGFLFSMLMGYLLNSTDKFGLKRLSNEFSSYQLFKITLEFIGKF